MSISTLSQLDLSTSEQIENFQGSLIQNSPGGGSQAPAIAADPAAADRLVTQLRVHSQAATDFSRVEYTFVSERTEVWLEFEVRYGHTALPDNPALSLLVLTDSAGTPVAELRRDTDLVTLWGAIGGPAGLFTIVPNTWTRIRLRYRTSGESAPPDGILEAWRYNTATGVYDLQFSMTGITLIGYVRKFVLNCAPTGALGAVAGNKTVWYLGLTWGDNKNQVGFKNRGLQLRHVCSVGTSSTTVNGRLFYRFPRAYHGMALGTETEPMTLSIQFQYKRSIDTAWIDSGGPVTFVPDARDEIIVNHSVTGLTPLVSHDFRAVSTDSASSFALTTEVATCITPSAAGGSPGILKYAFGSCANQLGDPVTTTPHPVMTAIKNQGVHGIIHLGDMMYGSVEAPPGVENEVEYRWCYRKNLLHDFEQNRLHESAAFFPMWDDHESRDQAWGANTNSPFAGDFVHATAAANAYWINGRLNAIVGGNGWWFDTAKCRFIIMDMRSAKNITDGSRTMLGETQHLAVKALLENTGKPLNFLFSPGPVVTGHVTPDADGWNSFPEFVIQRDQLLSHFFNNNNNPPNPANSILIVCSGDRHFCYVASNWGNTLGSRVKPEWCSSPLAIGQRPPNLTAAGTVHPVVEYLEPTLGNPPVEPGPVIHRYGLIEVNESTPSVTISLIDGATGNILFSRQYAPT